MVGKTEGVEEGTMLVWPKKIYQANIGGPSRKVPTSPKE